MQRAILTLVLFTLILASCTTTPDAADRAAATDPPPSGRAVTTPTPTLGPAQFDRSNWDILFSDPEAHKGAAVDIVGRVLASPERNEDGVYWQMFANPQQWEWNTTVAYGVPDFPISEDDYVRVQGIALGADDGVNAFGGTVKSVLVRADSVTVVDALAAAPPAIRVYEGNQDMVAQHGLSLSVERIEFAKSETRVFVTVTNDSQGEASFSSYDARAVQGRRQFDAEGIGFLEYPEVQSNILPGIESRGVAVFPAFDASADTVFYFEAWNDDFSLDFKPYQFEIPGE